MTTASDLHTRSGASAPFPQQPKGADTTPPPHSFFNALKENKLKAAGITYIIGDAALAAAKTLEGDGHGFQGAAIWAAGGAAAAWFGNPGAEKELQLLERRLGAYLKAQGVTLPNDPATAHLAEENGVIEHITSFLYAHPSEMLNAAYAIGGAMTLKGAWKKHNSMDMACGALVTAGALAGLLIPEQKPDPDHPAQGVIGKAWEWVKEKPLRVSSGFYTANNLPLIAETHAKWKQGARSALPRFVTAASYLFANGMLFMSSKGHGGDGVLHTEVMQQLTDTAARVVAAQPTHVQEALVQQVSGYLASQPETGMKADDIAALLHVRLAHASAKTGTGSWEARQQMTSAASPSPSL